MAFSYKNIAYAKQSAFGSSIAVGSVFLPVTNFDLNKDPEASAVEQTTNTPKGWRRAVNIKDTVNGNAGFHVDFNNIGYWLNLGWGGGVTTAALGASATRYDFIQNSTGNLTTGRFDADKHGHLEAWQDVFATKFELTASDGVITGTIDLTGSRQIAGQTFSPSVTETRVLTFANAQWYYADSTGVAGATMPMKSTTWTLTYNSGGEGKFESGSPVISRQDTVMPTLELSIERFFDGSSGPLVTRNNVYTEDAERGMILELTSDSDDLIAGVTQYKLVFPIPAVKLQTSSRPYEAGQYIIEAVSGMGLANDSAGYMCEPYLITGNGFTF